MADRNTWVWSLFLLSSLGMGCVSPHRTPAEQASVPDGYQGSYVTAPPQTPAITTNASLQPRAANSFSGVVKGTTGRITSSFQKMGDALAIQPKVDTHSDPLSLSSKTKAFGPDMYLAAARMFEQKGDMLQANLQMEKALQLDPGNRDTLISCARMKHRTGALEDANRLYQQIIQRFPEDPVTYNDLGLCLARQGRLEESLAALSQAVERRPDSQLYRNNIATVLLEGGRADEALQHLAQVFEPAHAYHNLGYLSRQRGDLANAEKYFAQAQQLDGNLVARAARPADQTVVSQENSLSPGSVRMAAPGSVRMAAPGSVRMAALPPQAVVQRVHRLEQQSLVPPSHRPPVLQAPALPQGTLPQAPLPQVPSTVSSPRVGPFGHTP